MIRAIPGTIVLQHPGSVGRYAFGSSTARLSIARVRPKGSGAELRYAQDSDGSMTIAGGIDGARYRVTNEDTGLWFDIRVTSSVEKSIASLSPEKWVMPIDAALIHEGAALEMNQFDAKLHAFVFPFPLKSHEVIIEVIKSLLSSELTYTLSQITEDKHRVIVRFSAMTAARGDRYRVTVVGESEGEITQRHSVTLDVSIKG